MPTLYVSNRKQWPKPILKRQAIKMIPELPSWFATIAKLPVDKISQNFQDQFASCNKETKEKIIFLVTIFGYSNMVSVKALLTKYKIAQNLNFYSFQMERLKRVQQICLKSLFTNCSFDEITFDEITIANNHLYDHIPAFPPKKTFECVIPDIKNYLLCVEFPLQRSKALNAYSLKWIKELIDSYDQQLQEAIGLLFQQKQAADQIQSPNSDQQILLFKHAGLKGCGGRPVPWSTLLYLWNADQCKKMEMNYSLFRLLYPKVPLSQKNINLTFRQFIVKNSVDTLFHKKDSVLPPNEEIESSIYELFINSETERQNVIYYIDHLHEQLSTKTFLFSEELAILKRLVADENSQSYNFLHAVLHYFRYLNQYDPSTGFRPYLFRSIYALSYPVRAYFDQPMQDEFLRLTFKTNGRSTLDFIKAHFESPELWGCIFLRNTFEQGKIESPYMSLNEHLYLLIKIEILIKMHLPMKIIFRLLLLQTVKPSITSVINKFETIRQKNNNNIHELPSLFNRWQELHKEFLAEIGHVNLNSLFSSMNQVMIVPPKIDQLSFLLQFSAHPDFISGIRRGLNETNEKRNGHLISSSTDPNLTYFSDYLHSLSIEQGVILLDLFADQNSYVYNFFHGSLHYRHALKHYPSDSEEKEKFLHTAIFSMNIKERQRFDQRIKEDYILPCLDIDSKLLHFAKTHPISNAGWGKIILRSSRSSVLKQTESSFLDVKMLIELIEEIESYTNCPLSEQICEDLLYFQITLKSIFKTLKRCRESREKIKKNSLSLFVISKEMQDLSSQIMQDFEDLVKYQNLAKTSDRSQYFQKEIVDKLNAMISFATYPMPSLSFRDLIAFDSSEQKSHDSFHPISDAMPSGPAWMSRWMINEKKNEYTLVIVLTNPLHLRTAAPNGSVSCLFHVPLKVPLDPKKKNEYFAFLFSIVDGASLQASNEIDWTTYFSEDNSVGLQALSAFAGTMRTSFLRSFFYLLNPEEKTLIEDSSIETTFSIADQGICLSSHALGPNFNLRAEIKGIGESKPLSDQVWIKKEDYEDQFQEIFRRISAVKNLFINKASGRARAPDQLQQSLPFMFKLQLTGSVIHAWKIELKWTGDFEWEDTPPDQGKLISTNESIKMVIHFSQDPISTLAEQKSQSLIIQYPPFIEEKEFIHSMLWHLALLCMEK